MSKIELVKIANDFADDFNSLNIKLDFTPESIELVEEYISKTIKKPGKPDKKSYFSSDTSRKALGYGCYTGEVIRRNTKGTRWKSVDVESPYDLAIENHLGSIAFVVNKAFKRIYNGDEDNVYFFVKMSLKDIFESSEKIPKDYFDEEDKLIDKYGTSPVCIYSKKIEENNGIVNNIYQEDGLWYFLAGDDDDLKNELELTFLDWVKEKHPEFRYLLNEAGEANKSRIIRQKDGTYKLQEAHKGLFYDSHTIPSLQGNMKINYWQWIKTHPKNTIYSIGALIISFFLMIKVHWIFTIVFIAALLYNLWYWITVRNKFKGGDVNPGKVISVNPNLVAVATNMRKYDGNYPVLKIIETKLSKDEQKVGTIIPTVALYNDNPHDYPFWAEFSPVPVSLGITDKKTINHLLSQFTDDDINTLNEYIKQVPEHKKGIYKIDEDKSDWKNYKHVDLNKGTSMQGPPNKDKNK